MAEDTGIKNNKNSLMNLFMFRYMPYWPLFSLLVCISCIGAWYYIRSLSPMYEAVATVLIKDDKGGTGDSKLMEALNLTPSNLNLQNEIEIIHSKAFMKEVANELNLYTPVYEVGPIKQLSAYSTSPII